MNTIIKLNIYVDKQSLSSPDHQYISISSQNGSDDTIIDSKTSAAASEDTTDQGE